jgi:hypothetical protein
MNNKNKLNQQYIPGSVTDETGTKPTLLTTGILGVEDANTTGTASVLNIQLTTFCFELAASEAV